MSDSSITPAPTISPPEEPSTSAVPEETSAASTVNSSDTVSEPSVCESDATGNNPGDTQLPPEDTVCAEERIKIRINLKKIILFSMIVLSSTVFIITAALISISFTNGLSREDITSKVISSLLATIFGNDSIEEFTSFSRESNNTDTQKTPEKEIIPSLESDSGENPTNGVREIILTLSNETPYEPKMDEILSVPRVIPAADELYSEYGDDAPIVLILHTHATEGYADMAENGYRTGDTSRSVVEIGRIIAEKLDESGINTIHCTTLFDADDFTLAYYNASLKIKKTLEDYPSISYIIDIHRDSIETSDGEYYAPTASIDGIKAAQLMFVVGTDHGGSGHENWENNLAVASRIQADIMESYPNLMRSINLRSASFNEQYSSGSMLIEVGSCASTLDEAKVSAEILAEHLIKEILGN